MHQFSPFSKDVKAFCDEVESARRQAHPPKASRIRRCRMKCRRVILGEPARQAYYQICLPSILTKYACQAYSPIAGPLFHQRWRVACRRVVLGEPACRRGGAGLEVKEAVCRGRADPSDPMMGGICKAAGGRLTRRLNEVGRGRQARGLLLYR